MEQPLPANFSCNLGSLNLSEFVVNPYTDDAYFDDESFEEAIRIAVRALDNIIDENLDKHALKEQAENSKNYRNIGLGVMGYANALMKLGLVYGSEETKVFTTTIFHLLALWALKESNELAKEKGAFPKCKQEKIIESKFIKHCHLIKTSEDSIMKHGLRNCSLISIAPTGSISTMLGVSGGCEPEFALSYTRRTENLKESYEVYCKSANEYWETQQSPIEKRTLDNLPEFFVTSKDIHWKDRIDIQSVMQEYVDTAISSTINLHNDIPLEEVEKIYLYAWKKGLKGITIYRSGCKREGILITEDKNKIDNSIATSNDISNNTLPRGVIVETSDDLIGYKRKLTTGCGTVHLETYVDEYTGEPQETFINIGSSGGCERNYQFISRLISLCLRAGVPIEAIIEQGQSIRPCIAYTNRTKTKSDTSKGTSCPAAIAHALEALYSKTKERCFIEDEPVNTEDCSKGGSVVFQSYYATEGIKDHFRFAPQCPDCGEPLVFEGGCDCCKACGYSHCG